MFENSIGKFPRVTGGKKDPIPFPVSPLVPELPPPELNSDWGFGFNVGNAHRGLSRPLGQTLFVVVADKRGH